MNMRDAINGFTKQFEYEPIVQNNDKLRQKESFIVVGMGGSGHPAEIVKYENPSLDITVHRDYGLPDFTEAKLRGSLMILSSYSGNTEEVLDAFQRAKESGFTMAVIAMGGRLLALAKEEGIPYIQLPDTGIQPRSALGFSTKALCKIIGAEKMVRSLAKLAHTLAPADYEEAGKRLAETLKGKVPMIYASRRNGAIAMLWKIIFNETGKIPMFYNVFPELNHNEMQGFDVKDSTRPLSEPLAVLILKDPCDHPKIQARMQAVAKLYRDRGLYVEMLEIKGNSLFFKVFSSITLANWAAFYTAQQYGVDAEQIPMVEEFKKMIT